MSTAEILLRLAIAVVLSGAVGMERSLTGKVAGIRTHVLVGLGAAIFTIVSGYAFGHTASNSDRIAAQVVSGLGFIAGGVILRERGSIKGLTTAADLWAVASLGMAVGAGLYALGIAGAVVVLITLVLLRYVEAYFPRRRYAVWQLDLTMPGETGSVEVLTAIRPRCHHASLTTFCQAEETRVSYTIGLAHDADLDALTCTLRGLGARSITWQASDEPGQ